VIWRIANRQIMERWAYLESPHPERGRARESEGNARRHSE
jgi:hypothetical protein